MSDDTTAPQPEAAWGVDSEHGRLLDVLVCPPTTSAGCRPARSPRATLESGRRFDGDLARRQHAAMVAAYEEAGVESISCSPTRRCRTRCSHATRALMTTGGAVITQLHQWWRRGEYAAAIRFYQENEIPIRAMITAGALEGGDVMILEPGCAVIGAGEARTQEHAARQLAGWLAEDGWEVRVEPIPERFVHIDVLLAVLAERLAAVCADSFRPDS